MPAMLPAHRCGTSCGSLTKQSVYTERETVVTMIGAFELEYLTRPVAARAVQA